MTRRMFFGKTGGVSNLDRLSAIVSATSSDAQISSPDAFFSRGFVTAPYWSVSDVHGDYGDADVVESVRHVLHHY